MIFKEIIAKNIDLVQEAVTELFAAASANQSHPHDLLLASIHAYYDKNGDSYMVGPGFIGHASHDDYILFDWYRKSHLMSKVDWLPRVKAEPALMDEEKNTIQIEKLIYLKYWESDYLMKQLYHVTELAVGHDYNWYFELPSVTERGGWQEMIRIQIRDKCKDACPKFYALLKSIYVTQVRNAIAHSQYVIWDTERIIEYLNFSSESTHYSPVDRYSYDEWGNIFVCTLLLHSEFMRHIGEESKSKKILSLSEGFLEIRRKDLNGEPSFARIFCPPDRSMWAFVN